VERIYREPEVEAVMPLLRQYGVRYILVGELERERFRGPGLEKFNRHPELFASVVRSGGSELYELRGSAAPR
jgi:uncharacterized membrane protein